MTLLATFKHISSKNADYGAAEAYLTFEHDEFTMKPTLDENGRLIPREDYRISSLNCGGEDFAVACMRANLRYEKNQKREDVKSHHYQSYGNGSAMRVSSAAWLAKDMAETLRLAWLTAEVTHDHPEGIKGAQAVAAAIFLARTGHDKAEIKAYVEREFGYDLSRSCDEIRPTYHHVESCQETVPQAIIAFLESTSFEDALRTAVSLGGDSDTLAAITGSIAEAFYGVPEELRQECRKRLTPELAEILIEWEKAAL